VTVNLSLDCWRGRQTEKLTWEARLIPEPTDGYAFQQAIWSTGRK
jgi:hypothetical protein